MLWWLVFFDLVAVQLARRTSTPIQSGDTCLPWQEGALFEHGVKHWSFNLQRMQVPRIKSLEGHFSGSTPPSSPLDAQEVMQEFTADVDFAVRRKRAIMAT